MQQHGITTEMGAAASAAFNASELISLALKNTYKIECFDADGNLKWEETVVNLICTGGATDLLSKYFKGSTYTAAWYVGIYKGTGTLSTADTMASHAGWTDSTDYSNSVRPTLTLGTPSGGSVDNSASPAVFNINATATILGAFIVSDSTKGGTTGILYGEAAFGASRSVNSGDTLNVTCTLTAS